MFVPDGMEAEHYIANPVAAAFHGYDQTAIRKATELDVLDDRTVAHVKFLP